ncbi:hypothetical protein EIP86_007267 [Pleurotus ostreatoroseus]|nr:hypothetical protein EIP86_007267 [Pleurotus ostreatoroseus]
MRQKFRVRIKFVHSISEPADEAVDEEVDPEVFTIANWPTTTHAAAEGMQWLRSTGMWRTKPFLAYNASENPIAVPDIARQLRNETVVVYFNLVHYKVNGAHTMHAEFEGVRVIGLPRPTPVNRAGYRKDPFSPRKKVKTA